MGLIAFSQQMEEQDKKALDTLLNDVTSGALRKRGFGVKSRAARMNGLLDLDDSDEDEAILERIRNRHKRPGGEEEEDMNGLEKYGKPLIIN